MVSLHLDFAKVRKQQIEELIRSLQERNNLFIIAGDFNSEWNDNNSAVKLLAENMGLKSWEPQSTQLKTFSNLNKRIDWIIISPELDFESYTVYPDILSDHLVVSAEIAFEK